MGYPKIIDSIAFGEAVPIGRDTEKALGYTLWQERGHNENKEDIQCGI
jgi:hypothetical protein